MDFIIIIIIIIIIISFMQGIYTYIPETIPLLPLWAFVACYRVNFTFTFYLLTSLRETHKDGRKLRKIEQCCRCAMTRYVSKSAELLQGRVSAGNSASRCNGDSGDWPCCSDRPCGLLVHTSECECEIWGSAGMWRCLGEQFLTFWTLLLLLCSGTVTSKRTPLWAALFWSARHYDPSKRQ
jgi:hypothetical protein